MQEGFPRAGDQYEFDGPYRRAGSGTVRRSAWPVIYTDQPAPLDAIYPRACRSFRWRSPGGEWKSYNCRPPGTFAYCISCGEEYERGTASHVLCVDCRHKREEIIRARNHARKVAAQRAKAAQNAAHAAKRREDAVRTVSGLRATAELGREVRCNVCGKSFCTRYPHNIYCSAQCFCEGRRRRDRMALERKKLAKRQK